MTVCVMKRPAAIDKELDSLYQELSIVQSMSEESVRLTFNTDSKPEYIALLNGEIGSLESELDEVENYNGRQRNDERTADLPFLCW